jgi:triosephosphate isomerase (TIM)
MRKKIVAGNWKMNLNVSEGVALVEELNVGISEGVKADELIVFPPFTHLYAVKDRAIKLQVGAQNCHTALNGAYTGEVSAPMLSSIQISHVLVGHSERRAYFNELNDLLAKKVDAVLDEGMTAVYCCGETLPEREENRHFNVIGAQLAEGLFHLNENQLKQVVIAYEPVWAIGTGKTASSAQAQEVHAYIRKLIATNYTADAAENMSILYGGSCNPANAQELFSQPDVDGGLIGGASLKSADFIQIANSY